MQTVISKLTKKYQATVPKTVREKLFLPLFKFARQR